MYLRTVSVILIALVFGYAVGATHDFVEEEDGSLSQLNGEPGLRNGGFKWKKCRKSSDCGAGYYCSRGHWCRPLYGLCSINAHCPAITYCDTDDGVCKPGDRVCKAHESCGYYMYCKNGVCVKKECHWYRACPYGHKCVSPGLCKLKNGYCKEESHCSSNECCLRYYGKHYPGVCSRPVRPGHWCDLKEKTTCACAQGYSCTRYRGSPYWGRCTVTPTTIPPQPTTPEPTEEPGSGSGEIEA